MSIEFLVLKPTLKAGTKPIENILLKMSHEYYKSSPTLYMTHTATQIWANI